MDPELFRAAGFTGAVLVTASVYAAVFGLFFTFTLYLQSGLGWAGLEPGPRRGHHLAVGARHPVGLRAGVGMGLIVAAVLGLGLAGVPAHLAGAASGVINNVQQVAGAVGLGVVGSVYVAGPRDEITGAFWVVVALAASAAPSALPGTTWITKPIDLDFLNTA